MVSLKENPPSEVCPNFSQVLQTPNAISVHNTAVISHPTPKGLPGTNSYQSMTIVHPNSAEKDRRTVAAEAERVKHIFPGTGSLIKHDGLLIHHHLSFYTYSLRKSVVVLLSIRQI